MKDFKFLRFLDKLKPIFERFRVDYQAMRKILQIKLIMDGKRALTIANSNNTSNDRDDSNKFIKSLWVYVLMGLMLIPFVVMKTNYIFQMSIAFGVIMFLIMSSLISDFSSVLLDVKDKNIIGTKPVNGRTLSFAKTIHVSLYMSYITLALIGPALLVSLFKQGIVFFLMFILLVIFMDMLIIVLTSFIYLLILRVFDGEKLKDIINYIQILLTIVITIGYQLVGRLFNVVELTIEFTPKWWQYLLPPVWFSAPFHILKTGEINGVYITFTVMSLLIPIGAMILYVKMMPVFEESLQKLTNNYGKARKSKRSLWDLISKILCRNKEERIFFKFTSDMMKNEREFKLKVYPTLGFSIIFPFIFIFQQLATSSLQQVSKGRSYFFIYFSGLMVSTLMIMLMYSEKHKGAWIYKAMPINSYVNVFKGAIKAVLVKLFLPVFLLQAVIFIIIFGPRITVDLIVVFLNTIIFSMIYFIWMKKSLPFSEAFEATKQASNAGGSFLITLALGAMAGIHLLISKTTYGGYVLLAIAIIANLLLWKVGIKTSVEKFQRTLEE